MSITIRQATAADAPALADLIRGLELFANVQAETLDQSRERVDHLLALDLAGDSHSVYVAQIESGEVVGYGAVHWLPYLFLPGPEGYVSELFIRDSARGQGIGGRLLDVIKDEARQRGCFRLTLINMRHRESYQRQFYKKHGWEESENAARFIYYLMEH